MQLQHDQGIIFRSSTTINGTVAPAPESANQSSPGAEALGFGGILEMRAP